jgi:hypothetical protein
MSEMLPVLPTPVPQTFSYPDPITQLWQGNPLAYIAGILIFIVIALAILIVVVKLKMPQLSWALFKNNLKGGGPVIASVYENNSAKFFTPKLFQSAVAYDGEWFLFPKAYAQGLEDLSVAEREILMSACSIEGAPGQLYFNYSIQSLITTPKLLAMIQHEKAMRGLTAKDAKIKVPKSLFMEALERIDDEYITISPMTISLPLSIKGLKEVLPKSLRKHDLKAIENLVREWMKGQGIGLNWAMVAAILAGIGIIAAVILHFVG